MDWDFGGGGGGVQCFVHHRVDIESGHFAFIELNWYSLYSEPYHCDI